MEEKIAKQKKTVLLFISSFIVSLGLTFLVQESQFNASQTYVIFLLFFSISLWLTEAIPAFAVSLFIIAYLVFALGNKYFNDAPMNIAPYANTFSSSVIWLLLGGFFLAAAMTKTKLDKELFKITLRLSGTNPKKILISLMLTTMVASMLMSNSAITAMMIAAMMPLLTSLGKDSDVAKAFLLGIPLAATTGGMGTIIGTPSNAIASGLLTNAGINVDFIEWMKYGVPVAIVLTSIACFVLIKLYIKDTTPINMDFMENKDTATPKSSGTQKKIVIVIILITVGLWLTTSLHGLTVASICAVPLVFLTLTGVLDSNDMRTLPWDTLLLVAGGLSLGLALENTGLLAHYSQMLISMKVENIIFIAIMAFLTMVVSNIMSNTAASTVMIPLGMTILFGMKLEIAMIIAFAASSAMFLPVSTPPNAIAYSTGLIKQKDFRVGGILIGILGPIIAILWVLVLS